MLLFSVHVHPGHWEDIWSLQACTDHHQVLRKPSFPAGKTFVWRHKRNPGNSKAPEHWLWLTIYVLLSPFPPYMWGRLSLFFPLKGLGRNQHCLYFFLSIRHVNTLAQLSCSKHSYVDFLNISSNLLHILCHEALQLSPQDQPQTGKYDVPIQKTSQRKSPVIKLRHESLTGTVSPCVFAWPGPKTREKRKTNQQQTWGNACRRAQHQRHPWHAFLAYKTPRLHRKQ